MQLDDLPLLDADRTDVLDREVARRWAIARANLLMIDPAYRRRSDAVSVAVSRGETAGSAAEICARISSTAGNSSGGSATIASMAAAPSAADRCSGGSRMTMSALGARLRRAARTGSPRSFWRGRTLRDSAARSRSSRSLVLTARGERLGASRAWHGGPRCPARCWRVRAPTPAVLAAPAARGTAPSARARCRPLCQLLIDPADRTATSSTVISMITAIGTASMEWSFTRRVLTSAGQCPCSGFTLR